MRHFAVKQDLEPLLKFTPSKSHECNELYSTYAREVLQCMIADKAGAVVETSPGVYVVDENKLKRVGSTCL